MKFYKVKAATDGTKIYGDGVRTLIADELITPEDYYNWHIAAEDVTAVNVNIDNVFEFLGALFEC